MNEKLGSTYDGDLETIKALIEDPQACIWSRSAALNSFLVLFKDGVLERDEILNYFKSLFHHSSFIDNEEAMAMFISSTCGYYPYEIYSEIKEAYEMDRVDLGWIGLKDVDRIIENGKEETLRRYIYEAPSACVITDVTEKMSWWAYEREQKKIPNRGIENFLNVSTTFKRDTPKLGRNDPCSCGSQKKYKKCCLK